VSAPTAWITVAVTDRASALATMLDDLIAQSDEAGITLTMLVVENSSSAQQRGATRRTIADLRRKGLDVELLSCPPYRRSIAASRERQRVWIAERLERYEPPCFIWMLDDDKRLDHLVLDGTLRVRRLEHHMRRLLELSHQRSRPDLLIGTVTGDPPIPSAATFASRLADLEANLRRLFARSPGDATTEALADLRASTDFDDYYDFSHERSTPTWQSPCRWSGAASTVKVATDTLLSDAGLLSAGLGFTRPILTSAPDLARLEPGYRRGGNAVFFTPEAAVEHTYPSLRVRGLDTRRGDMIGSRLLSRRWRVAVGGFSVRHCRARASTLPTRKGLERSILSDNLGAALARGVVGSDARAAIDAFLDQRTDAIDRALREAWVRASTVTGMLDRAPDWAEPSTVLRAGRHIRGLAKALPIDTPGLSDALRSGLRCGRTRDLLSREAERLNQPHLEGVR
jgi:hypothetical protein